jgi:hypothetical protein
MDAEISIRADGSGKLQLEYRISEQADSLGRLDGNERWQTVPVGRVDFERGISRIRGLRLKSFSTKKNASGGYIINRAELEFKNIEALAAFFDAAGTRVSYKKENGKNRLSFIFLERQEGGAAIDPDLRQLVREVSAGFSIKIALSAPDNALLEITPNTAQAAAVKKGKKVSFEIGTGDLLTLEEGFAAEFVW